MRRTARPETSADPAWVLQAQLLHRSVSLLNSFALQAQLLDADVAPLQDDSSRRSRDILQRLGSGVPTGEDLYCEERAKEVRALRTLHA